MVVASELAGSISLVAALALVVASPPLVDMLLSNKYIYGASAGICHQPVILFEVQRETGMILFEVQRETGMRGVFGVESCLCRILSNPWKVQKMVMRRSC